MEVVENSIKRKLNIVPISAYKQEKTPPKTEPNQIKGKVQKAACGYLIR